MEAPAHFELVMLSAGWENGGNTTHRFLDAHPELYVYPFESQLGNSLLSDYLSSLFHFKYRYPEFPVSGNATDDYELFFDEEMKVRLRTPLVSKFRTADLRLDETERRRRFVERLASRPRTRANIVAAFFQATFDAWTNFNRSGQEHVYVGYSPGIGVDADRILADFPHGHVVHVVRNPFSAYADSRRRPFPQPLHQYALTWDILQHIALVYAHRYPKNFHIVRYEDLIGDPRRFFSALCVKLGLSFSDTLLYPSWNGTLLEELSPWGMIRIPQPESNVRTMKELSEREAAEIRSLTAVTLKALAYEDLM